MDSIIPQDATPQKQCTGPCGQFLPATPEYFGRDKWTKDKLTSRCRACRNAAQKLKKRRKSPYKLHLPDPNPTKYRLCPECKQEKLASVDNFPINSHNKNGLYHVCRGCYKSYVTRLAEERAAKSQEIVRTCSGPCGRTLPATKEYFSYEARGLRRRCKDCRREEAQANYTLNKEARNTRRRDYMDTNRESIRAHDRNRNALKKGSTEQHTAEDVKRQYERQKGKCYWCGKKLGTGRRAYHVDHIVPLARGGSNGPDNLVISCAYCNQSKQDKLPHEWFAGGRLL